DVALVSTREVEVIGVRLPRQQTSPLLIAAVIAASVVAGFAVSRGPAGVLIIALLVGCMIILPLPPSVWVGAAVVTAVVARGLVGVGVLPGYAQFVHLPLAWGALA